MPVVAVTHIHLFLGVALLLALVDLPDFQTPLRSMADSLSRVADDGKLETPKPAPKPAPSAEPRA